MPNLNMVLLMGNLTRDPELRYLPSNTPVANIGIAVNRRWRNQQGEQQEEVLFVDCEAFGRTAESINQYLRKGRPIFIEGRLKLDQWTDKEGQNRSKMKVVIETFQFVDSRAQGDAAGGEGNGSSAPRSAPPRSNAPRGPARPSPAAPPPPGDDPHTAPPEEEIPF